MKIRELIEFLEKTEKEANNQAHGEPTVDITLEFVDPKLDNRYFYGEIIAMNESYRLGCGCIDGVNLLIQIEEN
jgi:hypothetical protein